MIPKIKKIVDISMLLEEDLLARGIVLWYIP